MKINSILAIWAIVFITGCVSSTDDTLTETASSETASEPTTDTLTSASLPSAGIQAMFSGATFVSVITSSVGSTKTEDRTSPNQVITFGVDTVTSTQSGVTETGQYTNNGDDVLVAQFPDRDVNFSADGGNLIWDSKSFQRAAKSQFNSEASLTTFLDNSTYESVDQLAGGESAEGEPILRNWSISFSDEAVDHRVEYLGYLGTYSYVNGSSFNITFADRNTSAVVLDNDQLVVDSVIYEKELTDRFYSQEGLVNFLNGQSYKSVGLKPVGDSNDGLTTLGNWFIDFTNDTFSQSLQSTVEVGTVVYLDNDSFSAITTDQTYTVVVENDELVWNGTRYKRE